MFTPCHGPFGEEPGGEIAPQRHHQFARQGDDGDAPDAAARAGRAPKELAAERAVRLMSQPQPGELDRLVARARIARLADPLLAVGPSAAPRARREPDVAGDLAPIVEVLVETSSVSVPANAGPRLLSRRKFALCSAILAAAIGTSRGAGAFDSACSCSHTTSSRACSRLSSATSLGGTG